MLVRILVARTKGKKKWGKGVLLVALAPIRQQQPQLGNRYSF